MKSSFWFQLAGLLHFGLLWAGMTMPRAVQLRKHLAPLPPFIRRLFWVYFSFIGLVLVGFGALSLLHADAMAAGEPLARAVCGFVALFWLARLAVAVAVFDVRPYLTCRFYRAGHCAINAVFVYLLLVYGWAAVKGGLS